MFLSLPIKIINECSQEREIRLLADFIFIKTLYSNSCIYNATQSNLSRKTGFSRTKITRVLKFARSKGWVREHHGNLILAWDKTKHKHFIQLEFITHPDILNKLQLFLLQNKKKQCEYAAKKRKDLKYSTHISLREYKAALKYDKDYRNRGEICDNFVLSAYGASYVFNCSTATANRILLKLEKQGLIFIERTKVFFKKCSAEMFKYFQPPAKAIGSFWWFKRKIYNSLPNTIRIPYQSNKLISNKNR